VRVSVSKRTPAQAWKGSCVDGAPSGWRIQRKREREREGGRKGFLSRVLSHVGTSPTEKSRLVPVLFTPSCPIEFSLAPLQPFKKQRINLHICMRPSKNFDALSGAKNFLRHVSCPAALFRSIASHQTLESEFWYRR
jgi:hypothetical protein